MQTSTRRRLAAKAFALTATYDGAIYDYLHRTDGGEMLPARLPLALTRQLEMRYGENPHQSAALYRLPDAGHGNLITAHLHQGKALSYNNIADADAALECVRTLAAPACVIVKHANPCGAAIGSSAAAAYERAYATDPTSAFGGIIAFNTPVDGALASTILDRQFVEVMVAPAFDAGALEALATKPNVRVLETGELGAPRAARRVQQIEGGILIQDADIAEIDPDALKVVTDRQPNAGELQDALLAWKICRFVKSNAIVYCSGGTTLGVGAGQMSRVVSARIAAEKAAEAGLSLTGAVMASDAFFPFRDGLDIAAHYGIRTVIQPGGSMRDAEVIAAANEHGIAMLFTGIRHFRH